MVKSNRAILPFSALLLACSFFTSCYYDSVQELYGTIPCDTTAVTYVTDILPVMQNNCYTCHDNVNAMALGGGIFLEGFENLMQQVTPGDAVASPLYSVIAWLPGSAQMPKGQPQLSECDIARVRVWITEGAQNN